MSFLNGSKCYTIGPIEYGNKAHARGWREVLKQEFSPLGIHVLSPFDKVFKNFDQEGEGLIDELKILMKEQKFLEVHEIVKQVRNRDLAMVDISTFLVAWLDKTVPTFGSIDEIIRAKLARKPVFLIIDGGYQNMPLWLCSYFKPDWVYPDLESVIQKIKDIDAGLITVNNKYWRVLDVE